MKIRFADPELKQWFKDFCYSNGIESADKTERVVIELKKALARSKKLERAIEDKHDIWAEAEIRAIHEAYAAQMQPLEEENNRLRLERYQWEHRND